MHWGGWDLQEWAWVSQALEYRNYKKPPAWWVRAC